MQIPAPVERTQHPKPACQGMVWVCVERSSDCLEKNGQGSRYLACQHRGLKTDIRSKDWLQCLHKKTTGHILLLELTARTGFNNGRSRPSRARLQSMPFTAGAAKESWTAPAAKHCHADQDLPQALAKMPVFKRKLRRAKRVLARTTYKSLQFRRRSSEGVRTPLPAPAAKGCHADRDLSHAIVRMPQALNGDGGVQEPRVLAPTGFNTGLARLLYTPFDRMCGEGVLAKAATQTRICHTHLPQNASLSTGRRSSPCMRWLRMLTKTNPDDLCWN